jgi:hypothetical protein
MYNGAGKLEHQPKISAGLVHTPISGQTFGQIKRSLAPEKIAALLF